jgi:6-phosphogluconolactonase
MITYRKIASTQPVVDYLVTTLRNQLQANKKVLWLVPGGSSIAIAAEVSTKLNELPLEHLTITLTDERYGPVDHPDSNWRQLREAGFSLPGATLLPVLIGEERDVTVTHFSSLLTDAFAQAEYCIGFFGIGADGHTAGILPNSPAVTASTLAAGYDAGNFQRLTMTPPAIALLDEAVAYAVGEVKWPVFEGLETEMTIQEQPAQALKQVAKVTIFNDYKESGDR